jgi:thiol-disulfide isomerase/thioredoxin
MKKTIIFSLLLAAFFSCSKEQQKIKGTIHGGEGQTIYLYAFRDGEYIILDSTVIGKDEQFELRPHEGLVKDIYRLGLGENDFFILITDSTESVELEGQFGQLRNISNVKGSPHSEKLALFSKEVNPIMDSLMNTLALEEEDTNFKKINLDLRNQIEKKFLKWLDSNHTEPGALVALQYLDPTLHHDQFIKVAEALKTSMAESEYFNSFVQYVNSIAEEINGPKRQALDQAIAVGQELSNITLPDPNGKNRSLTDLRGKVVLVDCWASWCGPCRRANPEVVSIYNEFKSKGFEVFSVSLDSDKNAWTQAIAQDKLNWPNHVSDLKGWKSLVTYQWGIEAIPYPILLDKTGKVIAHGNDAMGENLQQLIAKNI